jgi:hypothetical protein
MSTSSSSREFKRAGSTTPGFIFRAAKPPTISERSIRPGSLAARPLVVEFEP